MTKFVALNSIAVAVISAFSLGLVIVLASIIPEARAEIRVIASEPAVPACLLQGWPHYDPRCHFDRRAVTGEPRLVRVVAY